MASLSKNLETYSNNAVFAIASVESIKVGQIQDKRPWISVKNYFDTLDADSKMILLLENASEFQGVQWAAEIKSIRIANGVTKVAFDNLVKLSKSYPKGKLIKTVDGIKLDSNYRRSYVPCKLPLGILKELNKNHCVDEYDLSATSSTQYMDVFADLGAKFTPRQMDMLIGHAKAKRHTISMYKLAQLAGYKGYESANLHYGKLSGAVAKYLGIHNLHQKMQAICDLSPNLDERGHAQWILKQPVIQALRMLGLLDLGSKSGASDQKELPEIKNEPITVRCALVDARIGQGIYRARMLWWWGGKCAVTGCEDADLLIASHAIPWSKSSNTQRLDNFNGLPLTPNLDKLFDKGLIAFSDNGKILISKTLDQKTLKSMGVSLGMRLRKTDKRLMEYLALHRKNHGY